jgi:hypothetical protein
MSANDVIESLRYRTWTKRFPICGTACFRLLAQRRSLSGTSVSFSSSLKVSPVVFGACLVFCTELDLVTFDLGVRLST